MSGEGWIQTTWGELATLEYGKSLRDYANHNGEIPVFGTNGQIGFTNKALCPFPSVIVGRKGAYRGIHYSSKPFFVIDTAFYLKPKSDKLDLKFAYYQLLTYDINGMDSGSAIPSTSREDFYNLPITLPNRSTQTRIAAILSTLDDKIEMNRQTNATLEAIAQAIFKEWFVDFRFPGATGEMHDSELWPIPKGWEINTLKDLTVKIGSGATPRGGSGVYLDEGIALIRSQNVYDSEFVWEGLARISDESAELLRNVEVEQGDVLLNITGASILRTCVVEPQVLPARVNQHVAIIRANPDIPSRFIHLYLLQQKVKSYLMGLNAGGSREAITKGHLESVPILNPPFRLLQCFDALTAPSYSEVEQFLINLVYYRLSAMPSFQN